ncbi:DUF433 domain-containing protein [uncultured Meiothermus sp.]|jgi:uncharacterized protein (DUF433 family)|uniref:DUF433 domain-containing protein n=1 Tax=uncultured Meiothermus sp. TaxID=157471 RepID=UPI0026238B5B|nr:DUF433 domain-containing protein [uncultured Meiothermus sp.]
MGSPTLAIAASPPPLGTEADGVVRVGATRANLDTLTAAFLEGATAEEIAQQYPSLSLREVYAVISYYLNHPDEVNDSLLERGGQAAEVRLLNQRRFDPEGIRDRLLVRRWKKSRGVL